MNRKKIFLISTGFLISFIIRAYFIINGSEVADVHTLQEMGELYLRGINPYLALNYNAYPPLAFYIEAISLKTAEFFNTYFYITIKLWPNLADILTTIVLYKFLTKKNVRPTLAYTWALIFFLNPVSIIISAAHGQIDSITTFLTVLAIYLLTFKSTRFYAVLSFVLIGLAIAIKPNPLILLPFFLFFKKTNLPTKALWLVAAIAPTAVLILPFLQNEPMYVIRKLLNYSGANDFGLSALIRGVQFFQGIDPLSAFDKDILDIGKIVFLVILFILVFIYRNSEKLTKSCLIAYLLFIGIYFGISAQYLSWIIPLAVMGQQLIVIPFSLASIVALYGFYMYLNPAIIISQFSTIPPHQDQFFLIYVVGNLILWIITLYWLGKLSFNKSSKF